VSTLAHWVTDIGACLEAAASAPGGPAGLREVQHLEPCTVAALAKAHPDRRVEKNRKQPIPFWSPVGNVDVVVRRSGADDSLIAVELKWCYIDKLYEAIWDLFKMALLATTGASTYLLTGASPQLWANAVGKELFVDGTNAPAGPV
jgi:hypothetical protein